MDRWLVTRVVCFDVFVPLARLGLLIWSTVSLFVSGNPYWGWSTIAAILTPGTPRTQELGFNNTQFIFSHLILMMIKAFMFIMLTTF